jgi:hypothetical protein
VLVAAFTLIESRHPAPLVPLRIFRSRTLAGADALTILIGAVAVGMPFALTLYAQQVLGYSALKFGISSVVLAVGATAGAIAGPAAVGSRFPPGRRGRPGAHGREVARAHAGLHTRQLLPGHLHRAALVRPGDRPGLRDRNGRGARGVAEHEAGLASGPSNTALQTGTALGVAIITTVAAGDVVIRSGTK